MFSSLRIKVKLAEYVLKNTNLPKLYKQSEKRAVHAFQNLTKQSPRYREILEMENLDPKSVRTFPSFQQNVPLLTKDRLYPSNLPTRLVNPSQQQPALITSSSGRGGQYSFASVSRSQMQKSATMFDLGVALHFQAGQLKTLVINCLPMGVYIPSEANTVANVSVREDTAIATAETFARDFEQIIFICDPLFGKKLADQAAFSTLDWSKHRVHLIVGGETMGENFRRYLAASFAIDLDDNRTGSIRASMGLGEIGLNLLFETPKTLAFKKAAETDPSLYQDLYGATETAQPMLFTYDPARSYLEIANSDHAGIGELAISDLDRKANLPLVRYLTGDQARLVPDQIRQQIERKTAWQSTCFDALPMIALFGRKADLLAPGLSVSDIKDTLYSDLEHARSLTGAFQVRKIDGRLVVQVQLKRDQSKRELSLPGLENKLMRFDGPVELDFQTHHEFSQADNIDYERKFPYHLSTG